MMQLKKHNKKEKNSTAEKTVLAPKQTKEKGNSFGSKAMNVFSKLSKAFLLPIALLPIAGVFLGVGSAISSNVDAGTGAWYFGTVLNKMGDVAFGNLPILFAISTALAFSRDSGIAAITAVVGFLVMNGIQAALLHNNNAGDPNLIVWFDATTSTDKYAFFTQAPPEILSLNYQLYYVPDLDLTNLPTALPGNAIRVNLDGMKLDDAGSLYYNLLWVKDIPNGLITSNIGVTSLNTGVLAGIFVGAIAAWTYNKFYKTQLPAAISFFSGTKLVPIIAFFMVIPLSFIFIFIWPWIGIGLAKFGQISGKLPVGLDSFIFEIVERSLVPFGLHHVFYAPLWWTNAGGSISEAFNDAANTWATDPSAVFGNSVIGGKWDLAKWVAEYHSAFPNAIAGWDALPDDISKFNAVRSLISSQADLWGAMGDQTMMYKVISNTGIINFTMLEHLGLSLGRFQSGKFGFMLLGLPMAALAMWLTVPKQNRKQVMGIYFSAAFTCFLTGITEPIEYTFLFLAPWLFYGVHMPLAAISFLLAGLLQTHVSMTVSGGIIDYIVFGLIPFFGSKAMTWLSVFGVLFVALGMAILYFFAFFFAVKYGKVMVPGREATTSEDAKLFTKADYRAKEGQASTGGGTMSQWTTSTNRDEIARYDKAAGIIKYLGGEANITNIDSCASRLRVDVKDSSIVNKDGIMSLGGSTGALIRGQNVQVVYGGEQEAIKPRMIEILGIQRKGGGKTVKAVSASSQPVEAKKMEDFVVLVDENMMADCPKCGQRFKVELTTTSTVKPHTHSEEKSKVTPKKAKPKTKKKPKVKAKATPATKKSKKPVAKKSVAKKPTIKKTTKKRSTSKPKDLPKKEETKEFVSGLKTKYQEKFDKAKQTNAEKIQAEKNMKLRAKLDGSTEVKETRQVLQKHTTALRHQAKEEKITLAKGNLREMTKKEVISYLSKALKKMDEKK